LAKTISGLPSEQAETAQFPVRIGPLIGQKEPMRRQMQNARQVIEDCPDADGYVCLSDEIAISVKHLLWARGEKAADRILGFAGSSLAERHKIPSIGQQISETGQKVCDLFA
jgi:DNA-binding LacI/PurR family transcriptional regulator